MIFTEDFFDPTSIYTNHDLVHLVDSYTKESVNYIKTTTWIDGTILDLLNENDLVDGIIYRKKGLDYYVRESIFNGTQINVKWFGAAGNMDKNHNGTDDTLAFEKAIETGAKLFVILEGEAVGGGFTLYIPNGRYLLIRTLKLPNSITFLGESKQGVLLHQRQIEAIEPRRANVTNITGYSVKPGSNIKDLFMSKYITIRNVTFGQGGIILYAAFDSIVDNVMVINLKGDETDEFKNVVSTGLVIKLPVSLKVNNFMVRETTGTGILYEDSAGSGPSTTVTFNNLWLSHCKTGMRINGLMYDKHSIMTSWIQNSIFEYNETGILIEGVTYNISFRDIHFEQNKNYALLARDSASFSLENAWGDTSYDWDDSGCIEQDEFITNKITILNTSEKTADNKVHLKNIFLVDGVEIQEGYEGSVYVDGYVNNLTYPTDLINVYHTFTDTGAIDKRPLSPVPGYNYYNFSHSKPEFFDGLSWRNADGVHADIKRAGATAERPTTNLETGFQFFDSILEKPIYWQGMKWIYADGTNV